MILVDYVPLDILNKIENVIKNGAIKDQPKLGSGGYGAVYQVDGYAVKLFYHDGEINKDGENLFLLQGHPAFPKLYAFESQKYMITEIVNGKNVSNVSRHDTIVRNWKQEFKNTLNYIKACGLYRCDIHGNNVMLGSDGHLKIVDVGLFHKEVWDENDDYIINKIERLCGSATKIGA